MILQFATLSLFFLQAVNDLAITSSKAAKTRIFLIFIFTIKARKVKRMLIGRKCRLPMSLPGPMNWGI